MIKRICCVDIHEWHPWFAWHPVWYGHERKNGRYCRYRAWWVTVERRLGYSWTDPVWRYRTLKGM